jgi:hypothetical protein
MYVVRDTQERSTLAIVVRGTKFFSLPDWLSNLLIDPKPWPYSPSADDVKISHSTSRGTGVLQRLRSGPIIAAPISQSPVEQAEAAQTATEARLAYDLLKRIINGTSTFDGVGYLANIFKRMRARTIADLFVRGNDADLLERVEEAQPPRQFQHSARISEGLCRRHSGTGEHIRGRSQQGGCAGGCTRSMARRYSEWRRAEPRSMGPWQRCKSAFVFLCRSHRRQYRLR